MLLEMMDIPEILEDEDIVSWFFAMADSNGWDRSSFMSAFFTENIRCKKNSFSVVRNYGSIYKQYKALGFPSPGDMLMKHTSVPVSGLFTSAFYTGMLADLMLNGTDTLPFTKTDRHSPFMYCPLCAEEDMEKAGRTAAHVPHQIQGVTACYRHGLKLSGDASAPPEEADAREIQTAQAVQALYKAQAVGTLEDITEPLRRRISERGMNLPVKSNRLVVDTAAMRLAADLFTDDELERIYDKDNDWIFQGADIIRKDDPDARHFTQEFPFISYTCGKCGTHVTQYAVTAMTGGMCPVCARRTQWQAKTARRARHCIDPQFRIVRFRGDKKADIRHTPCNRVIEGRSISYLFSAKGLSCDFCRKKRHEAHEGEKLKMNCGLWAEITRFGSVVDIDLRFEDGTERRNVAYAAFLAGQVIPEGFYQSRHLGEKRMMKCGLEAVIIRYEDQFDMDVRFSDGSERFHVLYAVFRSDNLQPEGFRKKKADEAVIGQWRMMNCGEKARIIERRTSKDCDVEFEDGSIRHGVRQFHFLNGELSPEGYYEKRHLGEKRTMRNGLEGTITACPDAQHITVRLSNGDEAVVTYNAFRDGYVKSKTLEKRRKDSHVGERYKQNCGLWAAIVEYENANSVKVRFDNGEVREGIRYNKLKAGSVLPPSQQQRNRIGDRYLQSCGLWAEIIADRGAADLDVRFDNGRIRGHVKLSDLKKGIVQPLNRTDRFREEHLGEERMMKCGLKAKIIEVRGTKDIDVKFETGEVREHIVYANFKTGSVSHAKRKW